MKERFPLVSIITVNYNGNRFLERCFNAFCELNYPQKKIEIIMVDNGSCDGSLELVREKYPYVKLIENNLNNYCRANNLAIRLAKGEYVALVNNDVKVEKDWLLELVRVISSQKSIGAVTSKVLFMNGALQGTGHYQFPNFYWSDRGFKESDKGQYDKTEEVQSISHCVALYRRKCLDEIGLLDEDFNMYMEDVDMSIRAREKKWRLFYVPKSIAYHEFHGTADEEMARFYCERNRLLLVAKHFPERLSNELFGKGYFTVLNKNDLKEILPLVFVKLTKHHSQDTVNAMLPHLFEGVNKILSLEKDYLIKEIDAEKNRSNSLHGIIQQKEEEISRLDERVKQDSRLLSQKEGVIQEKEREISNLYQVVSEKERQLSRKDEVIQQKDQVIQEQDKEIFQKGHLIQQRDSEISHLNEKINQASNFLSEKERQLSRKDEVIQQKDQVIQEQDKEISRRDQLIQQKERDISQLNGEISHTLNLLSEKEKQLTQRGQILQEKDGILQQRDSAISNLNNEINRIYNSETYRFIARPIIWPIFKTTKSLLAIPREIARRIREITTFLTVLKRDKSISLAQFSAQSVYAQYGQSNIYFIKVTNQGSRRKKVKAGFDIYKYNNFKHPDGHRAYFFTELILDPKQTVSLKIDYNWKDEASFSIAEQELEIVDFWTNKINDCGLYSLQAMIYDFNDRLVDRLEIYQRLKQ